MYADGAASAQPAGLGGIDTDDGRQVDRNGGLAAREALASLPWRHTLRSSALRQPGRWTAAFTASIFIAVVTMMSYDLQAIRHIGDSDLSRMPHQCAADHKPTLRPWPLISKYVAVSGALSNDCCGQLKFARRLSRMALAVIQRTSAQPGYLRPLFANCRLPIAPKSSPGSASNEKGVATLKLQPLNS